MEPIALKVRTHGGHGVREVRLKSMVCFLALFVIGLPAGARACERFRLLPCDYEAAQARVDLIQQATWEIEASYYAVGNDRIAAMFLSLLRDAALRGVTVRLIVDAEHNDIPPEVQALLLGAGVRIKEFHPNSIAHPKWINLRMHDKVLIVDREQIIVGSRNLKDAHFGLAEVNYVDRDAYLCGPVVEHAHRYFTCLWNSDEVRDSSLRDNLWQKLKQKDKLSLDRVGLCEACAKSLSQTYKAILWLNAGRCVSICGRPIEFCTCNDWSACAVEVCCAQFVHDPCGRKQRTGGIDDPLFALIRQARASIVLETPYFLMSAELRRELFRALARGVQIMVLTNSLASTDQIMVAADLADQRRKLLRRGIDLWEYAGPNHLHAKSMVVDGSTAFVGSFNFDPRSEFLNTETGVVVRDPRVAEWVLESIDDHLQNAFQIGRHGRSTSDGVRNPGASRAKILLLQPIRIFAPAIRRLL
ncbi:MAG TPA: phosphatidylserine/phosphatidylglycerophosphate/cardiolipin synthase family protein [Pirellulales bacterium]|nr:phosphatidylserine/phosphatidylglycerophosphate/cardiolipin synthase family protein [Pirellulales bacterium]